jgi:hypothetical protein
MRKKKKDLECLNFDLDDICKVTCEPCPEIDSSCPYFEPVDENDQIDSDSENEDDEDTQN